MNKKIEELEKIILDHKRRYYIGEPVISDSEFDKLEEELRFLDPDSYVLSTVGGSITGKKVKHDKKMLSLEKKYDLDSLVNWISSNEVVGTKKIDGVSCSLIYKNGKLILAKTRGNGSHGEDITDKCFWVPSIPKNIAQSDYLEIRGEIYCEFDRFSKLTDKMLELGEDAPTSPRNIVAGLIGRKEKIYLCEYLSFQAFDIVQKYENFDNEYKIFNYLKKNNFIVPDVKLISTKSQLVDFINEVSQFINEGNYLIDGAVLTYNEFTLHFELGETSHHPKYKMAFKFKSEAKETELKNIEWNISRNGIYTPVGIIKETELSGAMVTRVTLHNYGNVKANSLKPGDIIKVIRSGEVIPKFECIVKDGGGILEFPSMCTYCKEALVVSDIRLLCPNKECPGRKKHEILNFISKIGIEDLSEKRLIPLMELKLVENIDDLYKLDVNDFLKLPKTKEKLAEKLSSSILSTKNVSLPVFLSALGLSGGALNKCEKIVDAGYNSIDKILKLSIKDLESIDGFANKSASEIIKSISIKKDLILSLINLGFNIEEAKQAESSKLDGLSFCITGKLSKPRSEIQNAIKQNGGRVVSSVTKQTNILICNEKDSTSSKMKNAAKFNVKVISESEFFEMM